VPQFDGIRDNISGYVDIFSGGSLRQDSTPFVFRGIFTKILGGHTLNFGAEFERTRIDANDYSYTPGDNTFIGNEYANIVGNPARVSGFSQIQQYFNTAAFTAATIGTFGNVGRNTIRGPKYFDIDMSLFKDFVFTEHWRLQFRAESFNTENRLNFSNPAASVSSGTFGRITAVNDPRVLQFALKLFF
jgi:hypothetical protein